MSIKSFSDIDLRGTQIRTSRLDNIPDQSFLTFNGQIGLDASSDTLKYRNSIGIESIASESWVLGQQFGVSLTNGSGTTFIDYGTAGQVNLGGVLSQDVNITGPYKYLIGNINPIADIVLQSSVSIGMRATNGTIYGDLTLSPGGSILSAQATHMLHRIDMEAIETIISVQNIDGIGAGLGTLSIDLNGFSNSITVNSTISNFQGVTYGADYSANYTDRSLIDFGYFKNNQKPLTSGNGTTFIDYGTAGHINLGGTLTQDVNINGPSNNVYFNINSLQVNGRTGWNGLVQPPGQVTYDFYGISSDLVTMRVDGTSTVNSAIFQSLTPTTSSGTNVIYDLLGQYDLNAAVLGVPQGPNRYGFRSYPAHKQANGMVITSGSQGGITDYDGNMMVLAYATNGANVTGSTTKPMLIISKQAALLNGFDHAGAHIEMINSISATGDYMKAWDGTSIKFKVASDGQIIANAGTSGNSMLLTNNGLFLSGFPANYATDYSSQYTAHSLVDKSYVDSVAAGLDPKASVRVATTGYITLSGLQTIDGVTVIAGDRVLVKDQGTAGNLNGVYDASSGTWTRSSDFDSTPANEVTAGAFMFVEEGTTNGDTGWVLSTNNPITIGVTSLTFVKFSTLAALSFSNGLTQSGTNVTLGGTLTQNTVILNNNNSLTLRESTSATMQNLQLTSDTGASFVTLNAFNTSQLTSGGGGVTIKHGGVTSGNVYTNSANGRFNIESSNGYDIILNNTNTGQQIYVGGGGAYINTNGQQRYLAADTGYHLFLSDVLTPGGSADGAFRFVDATGTDSAGREVMSIVKRWSGAGSPDTNNFGIIGLYIPNQASTPVESKAIEFRWQLTGNTGAENGTLIFRGYKSGTFTNFGRLSNGITQFGANSSIGGGYGGVVIGTDALINNSEAIAIGNSAGNTSGTYGVYAMSLGNSSNNGSTNVGNYSIALGRLTKTKNDFSISIGDQAGNTTGADGGGSISIGGNANQGSYTIGQGAIAIGSQTISKNTASVSIGWLSGNTTGSDGGYGISIGYSANQGTSNIGTGSIAIGINAKSQGSSSVAIGSSAGNTTGTDAGQVISIGSNANQGSNNLTAGAIAVGTSAQGYGADAIAIGTLSKATLQASIAIGPNVNSTANGALSMGYRYGNVVTNNQNDSFALSWNSDNPDYHIVKGTGQTITNVTTALVSYPTVVDNSYTVQATFNARETSGTAGVGVASWTMQALVYRDNVNAPVMINNTPVNIVTINNSNSSSWNATLDVNGNNIRAIVTGTNTQIINWSCILQITKVS